MPMRKEIHLGAFKTLSWLLKAWKGEVHRSVSHPDPSKHNTAWAILCVLGHEVDLKVEGDSQSQWVQVSTAIFLIGVTPIINKIWKTKISHSSQHPNTATISISYVTF